MSDDSMLYIESCSVDEEDEIRVALNPDEMPGKVGVAIFIEKEDGETHAAALFLNPAPARRVAAALLNGADKIEGVNPVDVLGVDYEGLPD